VASVVGYRGTLFRQCRLTSDPFSFETSSPPPVGRCRRVTAHQFRAWWPGGGQPEPRSRRWAGRGAIAPAALHFGERVIARSSRNASGAVITEKAGQPAVRRPPCASQFCAFSATRTDFRARQLVPSGSRDDSRPCPIPEILDWEADRPSGLGEIRGGVSVELVRRW
jgi:hypothetical protein